MRSDSACNFSTTLFIQNPIRVMEGNCLLPIPDKMRTTFLLFATMLSLMTACSKSQDDQIMSDFDVTVVNVSGDCKLPLLDFGSRTAEVASLIGSTSANKLYYAVNLGSVFSTVGTNLRVMIRKATVNEEPACITMGPSYPSIVLTSVVPR